MANVSGGQIIWILDVDKGKFDDNLKSAQGDVKSLGDTADGVGSTLVKSLGGALRRIGDIALDVAKVGIAGAATAITGLSAFGLKSAGDLQKTALSMNALTHSAVEGGKVFSDLYQFALKSPFAFPDIATAGKSLLAMGIAAKDVTGDVELLGALSASTGADLGSLADIFGIVSSQGRLMGGEILRLSQNGVAILPALSKQLGKTTEQVKSMASEGGISFAIFRSALSTIVDPTIIAQFENTLPRAFSSLQGALRNLAFSFVGVDISAGFKAQADGIYQATTTLTKNLAKAIRSPELQASFSTLGAQVAVSIGKVAPLLSALIPVVASITSVIAPVISALAGGLSALFTNALPGINAFFKALASGLNVLVPVVSQVGAIFGQALSSILLALAPAIEPLAQAIAVVVPVLAEIVSLVAQLAAQGLKALVPIVVAAAKAFTTLVAPISGALPSIMPLVVKLVAALGDAFLALLPAVLQLLPPLVQLALIILPPLITVLTEFLNLLAEHPTIFKALVLGIGAAVIGFDIFSGALKVITVGTKLFSGAMLFLTSPMGIIVISIGILVTAIVLLQKRFGFLTKAMGATKRALIEVYNFLKPVIDFVGVQLKSAFDSIKNIATTIKVLLQPVIDWFKEIAANQKVVTILKDIGIALAAMVAAPIIAAFGAIIAVIAAVALVLKGVNIAIDFIIAHLNTFKTVGGIVFAPLIEAVKIGISLFSLLVKAADDAKNFLIDVFNHVKEPIIKVFDDIKNSITGIGSHIKQSIGGGIDDTVGKFGGLRSTALEVGKTIVQGFDGSAGTKKLIGQIDEVNNFLANFITKTINRWTTALPTIATAMGDIGKSIITSLASGLELNVGIAVSFFSGLAQRMIDGFSLNVGLLGTFFGNIPTLLKNSAELNVGIFIDFFKNLPQKMVDGFTLNIKILKDFIGGLGGLLFPDTDKAGKDTSNNITDSFKKQVSSIETINKVGDAIGEMFLLAIAAAIIYNVDLGIRLAGGLIDAIASGIRLNVHILGDILPSVINAVVSAAKFNANILYNVGKDMIQGLINGAGSLLKDIGKFMAEKLPGALQGPFKKALGISSPSKVFAGYGQNIVEGLVQGIGGSSDLLNGAMTDLSLNTTPNITATLAPDVTATTPNATGSNGTVINQTNNVYNQVDLTQGLRDLAWQLAN